jgi:glycosyltransferase involved in cell wall biosynthesis
VTRPLRVIFLTSARTWRGSGVSLASIAEGLRRDGHLPHMLAGDAGVVDAFAALGLPASRVLTGNTGVREALVLGRALGALGADVVVVDRPRDLRLAALASLSRRVGIVNKYNLSRQRPPADLLTRLAYRRVRLTIFVSETLAARALARARYLRTRPHRIIREAVDIETFRPDPEAASSFRTGLEIGSVDFVLAVGSLTLDKRYDFLLEIWAEDPSLPALLVCGEGPHRERLRARADTLGANVRFLGHLTTEQLRGAYNAARCFVHAGKVETFGLSVLEAMSSGCPVLGVGAGAVPEVIGDAGVIVPADDAGRFLRGLRELLGKEADARAMAVRARRRVETHFSLPAMQQAYVAAIASAAP